MSVELNNILQQCENGLFEIFENKLKKVILYGSYARGDFENESDIDIIALVEMTDNNIIDKQKIIIDLGATISYENNIMVFIMVKDVNHFNNWLPVYPLYKNIITEGVTFFG